jgi:hypothetical protein
MQSKESSYKADKLFESVLPLVKKNGSALTQSH